MGQAWIAEEVVIFVSADGKRSAGRIAVGQPTKVGDEPAECYVTLEGFETMHGPIYGESTLQALLLGVQFLGMRLHDFLAKGGRVVIPEDDSDVPLDALFGPLRRAAPAEDPSRSTE